MRQTTSEPDSHARQVFRHLPELPRQARVSGGLTRRLRFTSLACKIQVSPREAAPAVCRGREPYLCIGGGAVWVEQVGPRVVQPDDDRGAGETRLRPHALEAASSCTTSGNLLLTW
eukprot:scaffold58121_cov74-Phaeocystis_antarctica.AAC.7